MPRNCVLGVTATLLVLASATATSPAHAETVSPPLTAESLSGVTLGASGGVALFTADARARVGTDPAMGLQAYGGYRFRNGLSPELALFHTKSVSSLSPGLRWWVPIDGRVRPWIGAHVGLAHATLESGDTISGYSYFSVDAGTGIDFMITRSLSVGIGGDFTYANVLNPPRAQPVPVGSPEEPRDSYVLDWLTVRAGIGITL